MYYLYPQTDFYRSFGQVLLMTVQVGIFPVVAVVFMKQLVLYRRYAAAASEVNREMDHPANSQETNWPTASASLLLSGEGQKERLELSADQLFFIASSDNYVQVVYQQGAGTQSRLFRSSLKNMEQQVAAHPHLLRCHRMYLVNLDHVVQVSGNAQGLRLHLHGLEETIPVSRSLTQMVREQLSHLSHSPQKA
jgi:DNA-binding LytR/AlgR family response regulator